MCMVCFRVRIYHITRGILFAWAYRVRAMLAMVTMYSFECVHVCDHSHSTHAGLSARALSLMLTPCK